MSEPDASVDSLAPATLAEWLTAGDPVRLLDVRNRDEIDAWRIDGPSVTTTAIPYMKWLQADARDSVAERGAAIDGEGPIVVVCGRGEASDYVAGLLVEAGIAARNLAGGMRGWARVFEARTVRDRPTVVQYRRPSSGCLGYLIADEGEAIVVDPLRAFTDRYREDLRERGLDLVAVVDTHVHADHVSGLRDLADATDARPVLPAPAAERGVTFPVETVADGEELAVGSTAVEATALPGHTTGMFGFRVGDVLLSGDSLFLDGVARPDLQDGADPAVLAAELHATLTERLARFDDETLLAPGHYDAGTDTAPDGTYTASLGDIRVRLSVFSESAAAFSRRLTGSNAPQPANADRIVAINLGREPAGDDAFELELGPNNCAATPR